jgi:hypothetical protein
VIGGALLCLVLEGPGPFRGRRNTLGVVNCHGGGVEGDAAGQQASGGDKVVEHLVAGQQRDVEPIEVAGLRVAQLDDLLAMKLKVVGTAASCGTTST